MNKTVNINVVEICLTCDCNLSCPNCCHSCSNFPSKEEMPLERVSNFIEESIKQNHLWRRIALIGGEPTLHPNFLEALDIICKYKYTNKKFLSHFAKDCIIEVVTNGYGKEVNEVLSSISDPGVTIRNDFITYGGSIQRKMNTHYDFYVAPIDLEEYKNDNFLNYCDNANFCGMGYTNNGFYPCSIAAHIDRVMGLNLGVQTLEEARSTNMDLMLESFCKYCGFYRNDKKNNLDGRIMSSTWQKVYEG